MATPRLRPDRSLSVDGGIDQAFWKNRARFAATYFYTRLQEVVIFDTSALITPATDPYGRYGGYRNSSGGLARGVELSGVLSPTRTWNVTAAYTFTNARERNPIIGDNLRTFAIPDHQFSTTLIKHVNARFMISSSLLLSSNYLAAVYDPATFANRAYRFDGLARLQVGASYRLPLGERGALRFFGNGDNIGNQHYYETGYRTPAATGMGGLRYEF